MLGCVLLLLATLKAAFGSAWRFGFSMARVVCLRRRVSGRAVNHQQLADMLDRPCSEFSTDVLKVAFAEAPIIVVNTDFNELVVFERSIDFAEYRFRNAVLANGNNGIEIVSASA